MTDDEIKNHLATIEQEVVERNRRDSLLLNSMKSAGREIADIAVVGILGVGSGLCNAFEFCYRKATGNPYFF